MRIISRALGALLAAAFLAAGAATRADEGMWLLNRPPVDHLRSKHGFEPTADWLEHLQKSCVRISAGGSGSIVSPNGLVMTNHHVGSEALSQLSTPERNIIEHGFYARELADELKCPDMEMHVLWSIQDVTSRVTGAAAPGASAAEAGAARRREMSTIEKEAQDASGMLSQVVTLYQGGRYHLYQYKRYTDVRLVMAPEQQSAYFGGDIDNFEYPRFNLDACFFRIYENGEPLNAEHYLRWSADGSKEGDLAFVLGHPGRTRRLFTVDHLKFLRDVEVPFLLNNLSRREIELQTFSGRSEENARIAKDSLLGVSNGRKVYTGRLAGLHGPGVFAAKSEAERSLRAAVAADKKHGAERAGAWDAVARAQAAYREIYFRRAAINSLFTSELASRALNIVRLADELPKPNADRLREYRDSALDSLYLKLYSTAPIYEALETERIASALGRLAELVGGDDPLVALAFGGLSAQDRAHQLVSGTKLKSVEARKALAAGGAEAVNSSNDPLIAFARALDAESRALRARYEDEVEAVETEAYAHIAAAQFDALGETIYPDATFTLRMSFGPIIGFRDGDTTIPAYTTIAGLYQRAADRREQFPFTLPQTWKDAKPKLDLTTPYNFICTADIIGGNSGSPVVNRKGEVIGLVFDGNIQSLISDYLYDDRQGRAVSVDSRAIIEALRKVYDAGDLADELTGARR